MRWKPISTAPIDGTEIIVGCYVASVWITRGAFWVEDGEESGWYSYRNSVTQERLDGMFEPTHWVDMPEE